MPARELVGQSPETGKIAEANSQKQKTTYAILFNDGRDMVNSVHCSIIFQNFVERK